MATMGPIKLNHATIQKALDGGFGVAEALDADAERVLDRALAIAAGHVKTGRYRASLHIETSHTDRMVKRVIADAPHAHLVERELSIIARARAASKGKAGR